MNQSEIAVSFTLDEDEARRESAELQKKAGVSKTSVRLQWGVAVIWLSVGIADVTTSHARASGWFYIVGACLYAFMALQMKSRFVKISAGVETSARFDVAGIVIEAPAPQRLPWSAVEGVDRLRDALVVRFLPSKIEPPLERRIVIPRRALADGGVGLWQLSEYMLLGPLRRVSAQLSVDETGALRRNDVQSIDNQLARSPSKTTHSHPMKLRETEA